MDPEFRTQFLLGRPEEEYDDFLTTVPDIFVGTPAMVAASVKLISHDMQQALDRLGIPRPPWRDPTSLLSKWMPTNYKDERFVPPLAPLSGMVAAAQVAVVGSAGMRQQVERAQQKEHSHQALVGELMEQRNRQHGPGANAAGGLKPAVGSVTYHLSASSQPNCNRFATYKRKAEVVRVKDPAPRVSIVGFSITKAVGNETRSLGREEVGDGAESTTSAATSTHRPRRGPGPGSTCTSAVSSLSDEWAFAHRGERKSLRATMAVGACGSSVGSSSGGAPAKPQQQGGAQAPAAPRAALAASTSSAMVQGPAVPAVPLGLTKTSQTASKFKPLDQLLPAIRTVRWNG